MCNGIVVRAALVAMTSVAVGCRERPEETPPETPSVIAQRNNTDTTSLTALVDSLGRLPGDLASDQGPWEFTGGNSIVSAFDQFSGDSVVVALVQCLDRKEPAKATARGRPVTLGVMCYWALRHLAYYEYYQYEGDPESPERWAGQIDPTATPDQLRAAKEAWLKVVRERKYHLSSVFSTQQPAA